MTTLLILLSLALCGCRPPSSQGERVVLITLDTLRYDSLMGSPEAPSAMPETLSWAKANAAIFDRCYSAVNSTAPTHSSLFTGLHPWQHGVTRNGLVLDERFVTLAERFQDAGFTTAAVVASAAASSSSGFSQGFQRFVERINAPKRDLEGKVVKARGRALRSYALADEIGRYALRELDEAKGKRQFFWFHFIDAHTPYGDAAGEADPLWTWDARAAAIAAGEERDSVFQRVQSLYSADVRVLDAVLSRLLYRLDRDSEQIRTHIVITSDHGEALEDGKLGHGKHVVETVVHIPALISSPRISTGIRTDVAGTVDLHSTLLALADISAPTALGRNLLVDRDSSGVAGMRRSVDRPIETTLADGTPLAIEGNLFFIVNADGELIRGDCENLMDLPGQETLGVDEVGLSRRFRSICKELSELEEAQSVGEEAKAQLRALGYLK